MIGILGGTFDPIHFGHLRPALDVMQALALSQVRFVPLNVAVHRRQPLASGQQRLAMVRAALGGQPGFAADERELRRAGGSYSYDTLESLRQEVGQTVPMCLLVGSDAFRDFLSWHRPEGILQLAHLVVMQRPGREDRYDSALESWAAPRVTEDPAALAEARGGCVLFQRVIQMDISATGIRHLVAEGRSPRYLLPDAVLEMIERDGLYRTASRI